MKFTKILPYSKIIFTEIFGANFSFRSCYQHEGWHTANRLSVQHSILFRFGRFIIIIITNPRGSLGHHIWFCNQFSQFFLVLYCPLRLTELQACPFTDVVFPPLPLSALSSSPFHCAVRDGLSRPDARETWLYHCSLRLFTMVRRSSCSSIAC